MASIVRRFLMPIVFIVTLCAVSSVYTYALRPSAQRVVVASIATNIVNLQSRPLGALIGSAFVSEVGPWVWVAFAIIGLFPLAHRFGNLRALLLVSAGQVFGTLVSEGLLAWRISTGTLPASLRFIDDVGPSYVIASALVATVLYGAEPAATHSHWLFGRVGSRWWRLGAALGLAVLAPDLFEGLDHLAVAAVGHVVSMITGAGVGLLLVRLAGRRSKAPAESEIAVPSPHGRGTGGK